VDCCSALRALLSFVGIPGIFADCLEIFWLRSLSGSCIGELQVESVAKKMALVNIDGHP